MHRDNQIAFLVQFCCWTKEDPIAWEVTWSLYMKISFFLTKKEDVIAFEIVMSIHACYL